MDKIQHTHSKAHVKAVVGQKAAVAIFACTTADPLTHRQIPCSFTLPNHLWNLRLEFKLNAEISTLCRVNRSSWSHVGRRGRSKILGTASDTQEVVISLVLIYLQENTESWLLMLQETNGTMMLKKVIKLVLNCGTLPNTRDCDYGNSVSRPTVKVRQSFCLCG